MPKLSIITINLNNVTGLQRTFESVFEQTNHDYEIIVVDGGSTDGSVALIEKYKDQISYWVSETDSGVYQAMNKAIKKATGEYLLFLNSGDYLVDNNVLQDMSVELGDTAIVYGNVLFIECDGKSYIGVYPAKLSFTHFVEGALPHPASFIQRALFEKVGLYDENLKICADWKFFMDAVCRYNCSYKQVNRTVAAFCLDGISSNNTEIILQEKKQVLQSEYPLFMATYLELKRLKTFSKHRLVNAFAKLTGTIGLLKPAN